MKKILPALLMLCVVNINAQTNNKILKLPFDVPYYILDTMHVDGYLYGDGEDCIFYFDTIGVTAKNWYKFYKKDNKGLYCDETHHILFNNLDKIANFGLHPDNGMVYFSYGASKNITKYFWRTKVKGLAMVYLLNNDMQLNILKHTSNSSGPDINPQPTRILKKLGNGYYIPAINFVVPYDWEKGKVK